MWLMTSETSLNDAIQLDFIIPDTRTSQLFVDESKFIFGTLVIFSVLLASKY